MRSIPLFGPDLELSPSRVVDLVVTIIPAVSAKVVSSVLTKCKRLIGRLAISSPTVPTPKNQPSDYRPLRFVLGKAGSELAVIVSNLEVDFRAGDIIQKGRMRG